MRFGAFWSFEFPFYIIKPKKQVLCDYGDLWNFKTIPD